MIKWTQHSFAGGQQDESLGGRQDLNQKYIGMRLAENFIVKKQGFISKRRGTNLIADLAGMIPESERGKPVRAIPFVYERDGGYVLLFRGHTSEDGVQGGRIHVLCRDGMLMKNETDQSTFWSRRASSDGSYEPWYLDCPYKPEDFEDIGYSQSGDTMWIAHPSYPFAKIVNLGGGKFSYGAVNFLALGGAVAYSPPGISCTASSEGTQGDGASITISYVCTYVKDGVESSPSPAFYVTYKSPWSTKFVVTIKCSKGSNAEEPDYYNVYKKSGGEYGFIGSTGTSGVLQDVIPSSVSGVTARWQERFDFFTANMHDPGDIGTDVETVVNDSPYGYKNVKDNESLFGSIDTEYIAGGSMASSSGDMTIDLPDGHLVTGIRVFLNFFTSFVVRKRGVFTDGGMTYYKFMRERRNDYFRTTCKKLSFTAYVTDGKTSKTVSTSVSTQDNSAKERYVTEVWTGDTQSDDPNETYFGYADAANNPPLPDDLNQIVSADIRNQIEEAFPNGGAYVTRIIIRAWSNDGMTAQVPLCVRQVILSGANKDSDTFYDDYITPDVSLTPPKIEQRFSTSGDYPSCVSVQNQRLCLAATRDQPFTLWFSVIGDLYNFNTHSSIREDDAIEATIPATEFPEINHVIAAKDTLVLCDNGEWVVAPVSGNSLSYKTIEIRKQSEIGCSKRLPPMPVGTEVVFAETNDETLRSIGYDFVQDGYKSQDLSVLSQSITRNNKIVDMAYKQHPDSLIVCVLEDGTLAVVTYMKEQDMCAWTTARLGGGLNAVGVCTDKSIHDGTTDLYIVAEKDGDYQVLLVREDSPVDTVDRCLSMDAVEYVSGVSAKTMEASVIPEGKVAIDLETGEQAFTLKQGREYAVGYLFDAKFRSIRPEMKAQETIQFELKGAKSVELRLLNPSNLFVVPTALEEDRSLWTSVDAPVSIEGGAVAFGGADFLVDVAGDTNTSGALTIVSSSVWPVSILSYSINFEFSPNLIGQEG